VKKSEKYKDAKKQDVYELEVKAKILLW